MTVYANKSHVSSIIDSLINGQFAQAKEQTQRNCKTKPELQAYRVGQTVGALCDRGMPDLAATYLNLFNPYR